METHQSMEQERGSVLPSKPQLLQQHVLEEERVHRPHLCNDRLEDIVQVSTLFSPSLSLSHTHTLSLSLSVSLSSSVLGSSLTCMSERKDDELQVHV
jgi:hypothetical protein